jgi:FkbM family methyltransferase
MGASSEVDSLELYANHREQGPVGSAKPFLQDIKRRGFDPAHILDVGANVGNWTKTAHDVFPSARITMMEPQEHLAGPLTDLCREIPELQLRRVAAGARFEQLDLAVREEDPSSTFCDVGDYGDPVRMQPTTVIPLDSLLDEPDFPPPALVKIDTEGFEMEVFKGAERTLASAEVLVVEVSFFQWYPKTPQFVDVVSYLAPRGFSVYDFCWFIRRPLDGALGIVDVCFVNDKSPLRASHRWAP